MNHTTMFSISACVAGLLSLGACHASKSEPRTPAAATGRVEAAGPRTPGARPSVTVYPVILGTAPNEDVATVVGMLLERGGLQRVEVEPAAYVPDRSLDFEKQAAAFGAFVAARGLATDYALFGAFLGSPQKGVSEVSGAIVDRNGGLVWSDRQRPGEPAFDRAKPDCPMDCSVLLVERLRPTLGLDDPARAGAPDGKLARRMQAKSGAPSPAELEAMQARLDALRSVGPKANVKVYPPRVGAEWSADGAARLAAILNERGLLHATAVDKPVVFAVTPSSNEQQVLWSGAKSIQTALRTAGRSAEYALFTDFLMLPSGKAGAVHTYLLSPDGDLVIVDFQNEHHEDFARIDPDSVADCSELSAVRLASKLE
jgi:hypothetical protein